MELMLLLIMMLAGVVMRRMLMMIMAPAPPWIEEAVDSGTELWQICIAESLVRP